MSATKLITAEELERLPCDGYRYDLLDRESIQLAPARFEHLERASAIDTALRTFVRKHQLGAVC